MSKQNKIQVIIIFVLLTVLVAMTYFYVTKEKNENDARQMNGQSFEGGPGGQNKAEGQMPGEQGQQESNVET